MSVLSMDQGSEEWLQFRKNKIGASDAGIIMGDSPWKSPFQLWQEKLGFVEQPIETSAMRRGKEMESIARQKYEEIKGRSFFPLVLSHPEHSWMIASMDGITLDFRHAVEIKCPGKIDHDTAKNGNVPKKYYSQLQHQMCVCSLNKIDYFSFDGENGVIIEVEKDTGYLQDLVKKERDFYFHLMDVTPPPLHERDYVTRENQDDYIQACYSWIQAKKMLDTAKEDEEKSRKRLLEVSENRNSKGCGVTVQKLMKKGSISYEEIDQLKNVDLEKYRKEPIIYFRVSMDKKPF